jgi:hypothetical protein
MFHPPSDTAGTHAAGISIHTTKSLVDDSCRVSPLSQEIQWTKRHAGDSHFLTVHDGNVRGAHALILCSCWRGKMQLMMI